MSDCKHQLFSIKVYSASEDDEEENILVGSRGIRCDDCGKTAFDIQQENSEIRSKLDKAEKTIKSLFCCCDIEHGNCRLIEQERDEARQQVKKMREILADVLSDCYLSDGMRSEIERLISLDGDSNVT